MDHTPEIKRLFSIDDIAAFASVSGVQLSPNGKSAVCVVTSAINNSYHDQIILIDLSTRLQKHLCLGSSPQWNPAGTAIAYAGDNDGTPAIYLFNTGDSTNEFLVNIYHPDYFVDHYAAANFCWSPDGKAIAYISAAAFDTGIEKAPVKEFTNLLYKSKGGRGRQVHAGIFQTHIWLVNVTDKITRPVFISDYNEHSLSWSPDGEKICFVSNTSNIPGISQKSDVFAVDLITGEVNQLSHETGSVFQPVWSPDGKYIAYLGIMSGISTNDSPAEDTQLYIIPSGGGPAKCLTCSLDRRIEQVSWDPYSQYIYFTAGDAGNTWLYRVAVLQGEISTVIDPRGKVIEYSVARDGKEIIYVHTSTTQPTDVFIYSMPDRGNTRVTSMGEALSNQCALQHAETFWYTSVDDIAIQGWITKPAHFNEGTKYPLVLVIHGGPHNMFGYEFEERMQLLSANGYGVVFINPRGSSGYGQEFSNGCVRAWGAGDFEDLMRGIDVAINRNGWIDPYRLVVTGQSYGGYMTNRIITKTTRFRAAVADGSISNLTSFAGTSLYHSLMESEFRGSVYDNFDILWKCSPLSDVKQVRTPVLFLHGETDNEVPFSQAEEMFIALKKLGVETMLVQYTAEGHGWRPDLLPLNRKDLLQRMLDWFNKYLK